MKRIIALASLAVLLAVGLVGTTTAAASTVLAQPSTGASAIVVSSREAQGVNVPPGPNGTFGSENAGLLATSLMTGGRARARTVVNVTISNFHYCTAKICTFADQAYVRPAATGPVLRDVVVNPVGIVDVRPGTSVTWTYRDTTWCDRVGGCPGHNVVFEDGSVRGPLLRARASTPQTFSWTVPKKASPGTLLLYYCSMPGPNPSLGHSDIMTGALRVVE
ncbi:MAG: hypothetical protein H0U16_06785 [Actinobacteria bacterium]|nr:hypothetical protein [Actinomycetota bacterium]